MFQNSTLPSNVGSKESIVYTESLHRFKPDNVQNQEGKVNRKCYIILNLEAFFDCCIWKAQTLTTKKNLIPWQSKYDLKIKD